MPARVFVSYAHDTAVEGHEHRALEFANALRLEGIEANIDRYVEHSGIFWPRWMADEIKNSDFVLCAVSPLYKQRFELSGQPTEGRGARWEGAIVSEEMYANIPEAPKKFIAVLLEGATASDIPDTLHPYGYTHYRWPEEHEALYRRLTRQPAVIAPPLGPLRIY